MPAITTRAVPRAPGNGSRVTLVVNEVAELVKVGPEGYIHGWIKVGPGEDIDHSKITNEHVAKPAHDIINSLNIDPITPIPADDYNPAQGYEAAPMIDEAVKRGEAGDYAGMMTQLGTAHDSLNRDGLTTDADRLNRMITNAGRVARYNSGQPEPLTRLDRDDFTVPHDDRGNGKSYDQTTKNVAAHLNASDSDLHALANEDGRHDTDSMSGNELKRTMVEGYVSNWRGSSGGPVPVAMITHVADKLGRPYELEDSEKRTNAYIAARPAVQRAAHAIGDAMYNATQEWLKNNGIKNVELHRASRGAEWDKKRPFTSWSTTSGWTREGNTGGTRHESIPAERIFSLPPTGFGTYAESEAVVLPAFSGEADHALKVARVNLAKDAADLHDPSAVEAEHVYQNLLANYPPHAISWVKTMPWIGPVNVPLDSIDWDGQKTWAASHQKKRVKKFQARIRGAGKDVNPVTLVQAPGNDKRVIIDGHHRALAFKAEGKPVKAYIGTAPSDNSDDPWFKSHDFQYAHGSNSANKAAEFTGNSAVKCGILEPVAVVSPESGVKKSAGFPTIWAFANTPDLVKVGKEGYIHGWICVRPPCGAVGDAITHDDHGSGTITGVSGKKLAAHFEDGADGILGNQRSPLKNANGTWIHDNDKLEAAATGRRAGAVRVHDRVLYAETVPTANRRGLTYDMRPHEVTAIRRSTVHKPGKKPVHYVTLSLRDDNTGEEREEELKASNSVKLFTRKDVKASTTAPRRPRAPKTAPAPLEPAPAAPVSPASVPKPPSVMPVAPMPAAAPDVSQAHLEIARRAVDPAGLTPEQHEAVAHELAWNFGKVPEQAAEGWHIHLVDEGANYTGLSGDRDIKIKKSLVTDPARWNADVAGHGAKGWNDGNFFAGPDTTGTGTYAGLHRVLSHEFGHAIQIRAQSYPGGEVKVERAVASSLAGKDFELSRAGLSAAQRTLSNRKLIQSKVGDYAATNWGELHAEVYAAWADGDEGPAGKAGAAFVKAFQDAYSRGNRRLTPQERREPAAMGAARAANDRRAERTPVEPKPHETVAAESGAPVHAIGTQAAGEPSARSLEIANDMVDTHPGIAPELRNVAVNHMAKLLDSVPAARERLGVGDRLTNGYKVHWEDGMGDNAQGTLGATNERYGMSLDPKLLMTPDELDNERATQLGSLKSVWANTPNNSGKYAAFRDVMTHEFGHMLMNEASHQSNFAAWHNKNQWDAQPKDNMAKEIAAVAGISTSNFSVPLRQSQNEALLKIGKSVDGYAAADPQESAAELFDTAFFNGGTEQSRAVGQIIAQYANRGQSPVMPVYKAANGDAELCMGKFHGTAGRDRVALIQRNHKLQCDGMSMPAGNTSEAVSFAEKTSGGRVKLRLADLVKVGPEGYIHGYICVRPPCGQYTEAAFNSGKGTVEHEGASIGKMRKNADGTYSMTHIDSGGREKLGARYATRQDAAKFIALYHNLWALQNSENGLHSFGITPEVAASITAMRAGEHENAARHLEAAADAADQAGNRRFSTHARELAAVIRDAPKAVTDAPASKPEPEPSVDEPFNVAPHVAAMREILASLPRDFKFSHVETQLQNAINAAQNGRLDSVTRGYDWAEEAARYVGRDDIGDQINAAGEKFKTDLARKKARQIAAMPPGWKKDLLTDPKYVKPQNGYEVTARDKDGAPLSLHPTAPKYDVPRYFTTQRDVDDFVRDNSAAYRYDEHWQVHGRGKPTVKTKPKNYSIRQVENGHLAGGFPETREPGETNDYGDPDGDAVASIPIRFAPLGNDVWNAFNNPHTNEAARTRVAAEIRGQLRHQDSLAPAVVRNTQITVTNEPQAKAGGKKSTLADFRSSNPNPPFHGVMRVTPEIFSAINKYNADNIISDSRNGTWWVPSDEKWKLSDVMIAHELGHGVAGKAWGTDDVPQDRVFWRAFSHGIGAGGIPVSDEQGVISRAAVDDWVKYYKNTVTKSVSTYGTTNAAELMAELWAEYTMRSNPRIAARLYGDLATARLKEQDEAEKAEAAA